MKTNRCITVALMTFMLMITPIFVVKAEQSPANPERVLVFLKDVIGIDIDKYETTLVSLNVETYTASDNPNWKGYYHTNGKYHFAYWDIATETYSSLDTFFYFLNSNFVRCSLEVNAGEPYKLKPDSNTLCGVANDFLENYKKFSADSQIGDMQSLLATTDLTKDITKTEGNLKFEVKIDAITNRTLLKWINTQNGVDFGSLMVEFENYQFQSFNDDRSYSKIGSSEVNISKEQAVQLALKEAEGLWYTYKGERVDNLTIVKSQILAELVSNIKEIPYVYYPCWTVMLPLDKVYPGYIYYIDVQIWADTGEIKSCRTMGYGGVPPSDQSPSDSSQTSPLIPENTTDYQINHGTQTSSTVILIVVAIILIPVLITGVVLFKKRKANNIAFLSMFVINL